MGRDTKQPIKQGFYATPTPEGYTGWVEDKAKTWILYHKADGSALFFPERGAGGAIEPGMALGVPSVLRGSASKPKVEVPGNWLVEEASTEHRLLWSQILEVSGREVCASKAYHDAGLTLPKDVVPWEQIRQAGGEIEVTEEMLESSRINLKTFRSWVNSQKIVYMTYNRNAKKGTVWISWVFTPQTDFREIMNFWVAQHGPYRLPEKKTYTDVLKSPSSDDSAEAHAWAICLKAIARRVALAHEYRAKGRPVPSHLNWNNLMPVRVQMTVGEIANIYQGRASNTRELLHYLIERTTEWGMLLDWNREVTPGGVYEFFFRFLQGTGVDTPLDELQAWYFIRHDNPNLPDLGKECRVCGEAATRHERCDNCQDIELMRTLPNGDVVAEGKSSTYFRDSDGESWLPLWDTFMGYACFVQDKLRAYKEAGLNYPLDSVEGQLGVFRITVETPGFEQLLRKEYDGEVARRLEECGNRLGIRIKLGFSVIPKVSFIHFNFTDKADAVGMASGYRALSGAYIITPQKAPAPWGPDAITAGKAYTKSTHEAENARALAPLMDFICEALYFDSNVTEGQFSYSLHAGEEYLSRWATDPEFQEYLNGVGSAHGIKFTVKEKDGRATVPYVLLENADRITLIQMCKDKMAAKAAATVAAGGHLTLNQIESETQVGSRISRTRFEMLRDGIHNLVNVGEITASRGESLIASFETRVKV